mgnify:CR=1 FL=1
MPKASGGWGRNAASRRAASARARRTACWACWAARMAGGTAFAQAFPAKPFTMIYPYSSGSMGDIIVRMSNGANSTVRLRDVARIELGAQQYSSSATINGKPTVFVAIFQLPGSNAIQTMDQAKQLMETLKKLSTNT